MTIKSILVPADGGDTLENVVEAALVVARRFDAHIMVLHVSQSAMHDALPENLSTELKNSVKQEESRLFSGNVEKISGEVAEFARKHKLVVSKKQQDDGNVSIEFRHCIGKVKETLIHFARISDTTAVIRPTNPDGLISRNLGGGVLEALLLQSGRPLLMVPPRWQGTKAQHAVIAWNHSLEASRALGMTLPWLQQMQKVTIVVARRHLEDGERVIQYLAWHGVNAKIEILNRRTSTVGKRILKICDNVGGDFLVMGGYSRSRMQTRVFGGVTDHVIHNSNVVSVLVH